MGPHQLQRLIAIVNSEDAKRDVAGAACQRQRDDELHRPHARHAGGEHEQLERRRRRQQGRDHQRHQAVPFVGRERALDGAGFQASAQERVAAFSGQVVQDVAAGHRAERGHGGVIEHPVLVLGNHDDHEQVVDVRKRQERGIEERHREETGTTETERQGMQPTDERAHAHTEYAEQRLVIISRLPLVLAAVAFLCGAAAWIRFFDLGLVLSHYDAKAHLVVARRVIDSITPGWQQIGAVWLPLPHLIQILPAQVDVFYRTGAFASLVSIASFTLMVWAAARLVLTMTGSAPGAITAAALLVVNPNLLYLQSTPMTESLTLGLVFLVVLWLYEWVGAVNPASAVNPAEAGLHAPAKLAAAFFAAAWTRYEAWLILSAALALAGLSLIRGGVRPGRTARLIARLAVWPALAILLFALNSRITTGQWLVTGGFYEVDPTYHGLPLKSLIAVWWGTHRLSGYVLEIVAIGTAFWLIVRSASRPAATRALIPLALAAAAVLPFYAFVEGHPFRIRYMVVLSATCALGGGLAVAQFRRHGVAVALAAALLTASVVESPPLGLQAPMLEEAQWDVPRTIERRLVTRCLRSVYGGEKIIASMGSLAHYMQELSPAGFDIEDFIHEGNGAIWELALATRPAAHAGWMIVEEQSEGGDILARRMREDVSFAAGMTRVCAGGGVALYRLQ